MGGVTMKTMDPSTSTFPRGGGRGSAFLMGAVDSGSARPSPRQVGSICSQGCPLVVDRPHGACYTEARLNCQAAQEATEEEVRREVTDVPRCAQNP